MRSKGRQTDEEYYEGAKDFVTGDEALKAFWDVGVALVKIIVLIPVAFIVGIIADRRRRGRHRG